MGSISIHFFLYLSHGLASHGLTAFDPSTFHHETPHSASNDLPEHHLNFTQFGIRPCVLSYSSAGNCRRIGSVWWHSQSLTYPLMYMEGFSGVKTVKWCHKPNKTPSHKPYRHPTGIYRFYSNQKSNRNPAKHRCCRKDTASCNWLTSGGLELGSRRGLEPGPSGRTIDGPLGVRPYSPPSNAWAHGFSANGCPWLSLRTSSMLQWLKNSPRIMDVPWCTHLTSSNSLDRVAKPSGWSFSSNCACSAASSQHKPLVIPRNAAWYFSQQDLLLGFQSLHREL